MATNPQLDALLRAVSAILVGYLIKYGIDANSAAAIAGGALAAGTLAWGYWVNRPKALVAAAAASPEVVEVKLASQEVADSIPNDKVTGPHQ